MERNVNCVNSRAVIGYVRQNYPELMESLIEDLDPFFYAVDNVEEFLCDEHNWISQHVCAKMFARVREYSGDHEVARKIGHESLNLHRYGYIENIIVKAFGHPYFAIKRAPVINAKFNHTKIVEVIEADWSHAVVRLKWFKDLGSTKDICLYNQGVYEAIPNIWKMESAKTNEHKCFFKGDEYCEFTFTWGRKSHLALICDMFLRRKEVLKESLEELEREKILLAQKYREIGMLNTELHKKIDQLTSLDECSKATSSILDTDMLLDKVMSLIINIMQFDRALIMLVDEESRSLVLAKMIGGSKNDIEELKDYSIPLNHTSNILVRVITSGIVQIIGNVDHSLLRKENIILKKFIPKSFIAVPLLTHNKVIGLMAAERIRGMDDFSSNDLDYVMNFCSQIAISLENARLIENMKQSFVSSILSLASALEAKDPYTRGHTNRVATYSTIVARHMEFEEEQVELIRLMALMHDVGKIGIPDSIINKPGRLTAREFMVVKRHPVVSLRIIEPLLANKPELRYIKSHHERYDGRGYPDALAGEDIPLEARILSVADTFDSMTSDRSYRPSMTRDNALSEIQRNKGKQFSPEIADVFIDLVSSFPEDLYQFINPNIFRTKFSVQKKDSLLVE